MKRKLLLSLTAMFALTASAQTAITTVRGFTNNELANKISAVEKQVTANLVCNTAFIAGTTMDLSFTLTHSTANSEFVANLELNLPPMFTPNVAGTTDPFMVVNPQPTADLSVSGQDVTWTSGDQTWGGIEPGTINFIINTTIDANATGTQAVSYVITGDGFNETSPTIVSGSASIADNNVPFSDAKVVATATLASFDANDGGTYTTANCSLSNLPVACRIANLGNTEIANFDVSYVLNDGTPVTESVTDTTIAAGDSIWYYFNTVITTVPQGAHELKTYISLSNDVSLVNDTSVGINFINSIQTDLSSENYVNNMNDVYGIFSLTRNFIGSGAAFGISSTDVNSAPFALNFSPSVAVGYPEGFYTTFATSSCLDVVAGSQYVIKYFRKSNTDTTNNVPVNGQTAILIGESTNPTTLDTIREFTPITPSHPTTGSWELDSVIYIATETGTRYFSIAGKSETTGTQALPTKIGNVRIDDLEVYLLSALGIEENIANTFTLYPNPANDVVTVSLVNASETNITLFSADGKVIESRDVSSSLESFNVESLTSGVYFFKVGQNIQKLMVK